MNTSIECSGKTVKEAIQNGLAQMGCGLDEVETKILEMGSSGIFGLFGKPAKVLLTKKSAKNSFDVEMPVFSLNQNTAKKKTEAKPAPKAEKPAVKAEKPVQKEETAEMTAEDKTEEAAAPAKSRSRRRKRSNSEKKNAPANNAAEPVTIPAPIEPEPPFEPTAEAEQTEETKRTCAFLKELTEKMGIPAELEVQQFPEQLKIRLSGEDMSPLIGRRGETLDALQYLTSLNVNRGREEYLRVTLDTENYRAKREEALRKLAVRMANRCKKSQRRVALEPMNPNERRILHSTLQNDPEVTTHSEGEEPFRRVIITLK